MFQIERGENGGVRMVGRLDAARVEEAEQFLGDLDGAVEIDLSGLDYISSAGISVLLRLYKRLQQNGHALRLHDATPHVKTVFHYAGLAQVFGLEEG